MSSRKNKIAYIKPSDPKFIQQFKKRVGYREAPILTDKLLSDSQAETVNESQIDRADTILDILESDLVSVVQSSDGDLSLEEAKQHLKTETAKPEIQHAESAQAITEDTSTHVTTNSHPYDENKDGKIVYKRPEKTSVHKKRSSTAPSGEVLLNGADSTVPPSKKKKTLLCMSYSDEENNNSD